MKIDFELELPDEVIKQAEAMAKSRGMTVSDLFVEFLEERLAEEEASETGK